MKEVIERAHKLSSDRGYLENTDLYKLLLLLHSEITELMEADRKYKYCQGQISNILKQDDEMFMVMYKDAVKGTVEEELADLVIRPINVAKFTESDIESHVLAKLRYVELSEKDTTKRY